MKGSEPVFFRYLDYDKMSKRARTMFGRKVPVGREFEAYIRDDVVAEMVDHGCKTYEEYVELLKKSVG